MTTQTPSKPLPSSFDATSKPLTKPEESKRIGRVLRIVQLIASDPGRWTRKRLADRFEMSERQIDNDLTLIRHALAYDLQRKADGYYFAQAPKTRLVELNAPHALALSLAAQVAIDSGTADGAVMREALGRLESALPVAIIPYLRSALASSSTTRPESATRNARVLSVLQQALDEGLRVEMVYATASRPHDPETRRFSPYHLIRHHDSWLVVGYDDLRQDIRMFKIDRIKKIHLAEDRYEIPKDFDLDEYIGPVWGVLRGDGGLAEEIVLWFTDESAPWVRDGIWHNSQEIVEHSDGSLTMKFHCSITNELVRWVLSFGTRVHVEKPLGLRQAVMEEACAVIEVDGF